MGAQTIERRQPGRRGRRRGKPQAMSEINVTPFVDVMLVLLIIFMVAAPLLTVGVPVELPETAAEPLPEEADEPVTVTLAADGRILVMDTAVSADALIVALRAATGDTPSPRIFLRADGAIPYGRVAEVMGALNAAGFRRIGLVTEAGGPTLDPETNR